MLPCCSKCRHNTESKNSRVLKTKKGKIYGFIKICLV